MKKWVPWGAFVLMLAVLGLSSAQPAIACVTCKNSECQATEGNGAEKCSSWHIGKLRHCKLKKHCQVTPADPGGTVQPETASLQPLRFERELSSPLGRWRRIGRRTPIPVGLCPGAVDPEGTAQG